MNYLPRGQYTQSPCDAGVGGAPEGGGHGHWVYSIPCISNSYLLILTCSSLDKDIYTLFGPVYCHDGQQTNDVMTEGCFMCRFGFAVDKRQPVGQPRARHCSSDARWSAGLPMTQDRRVSAMYHLLRGQRFRRLICSRLARVSDVFVDSCLPHVRPRLHHNP